jgi:hypothetical protein
MSNLHKVINPWSLFNSSIAPFFLKQFPFFPPGFTEKETLEHEDTLQNP